MKTKNNWFLAAGIVSIIEAVVIAVLIPVCACLLPVIKSGNFDISKITHYYPELTVEMLVVMITFLLVFISFQAIALIFVSTVYLKSVNKNSEEIKKSSAILITAIVLSFVFGDLLVGAFALAGFLTKPKSELAEEKTQDVVSESNNSDSLESKLLHLKTMKDSNMISEEEYKKMREDLLNTF